MSLYIHCSLCHGVVLLSPHRTVATSRRPSWTWPVLSVSSGCLLVLVSWGWQGNLIRVEEAGMTRSRGHVGVESVNDDPVEVEVVVLYAWRRSSSDCDHPRYVWR